MELHVEIACSRYEQIRAYRIIRGDRAEAIESDGEFRVPLTHAGKRSNVEAREMSIGLEGEGGTTDQGSSFMRYQKRVHIGGKIFERDLMCEVKVLQWKRFLTNLVVDLAEMEVGSISDLMHRR